MQLVSNKFKIDWKNPYQSLIVGKVGYGKTLLSERMAECHHNKKFIVIHLLDMKDKFEPAFCCFKPIEKWHLASLEKLNLKPSSKKIRLFHPFTFNIPKSKLPPINFFTIPIKSLGREEISMLFETSSDSNVVKLILNNIKELKNDEGLHSFMHSVSESIKRKKSKKAITRSSWRKGFGLKTAMAGTTKDIEEIDSTLRPFLTDYFLSDKDCEHNLNVERDIFSNQEEYKILVAPYIKDEKMKYFAILSFYLQILRKRKLSKYPILFIWEEIRKFCPDKPKEEYKSYLANAISDGMIIMRGEMIGNQLTTQVYKDVDAKISSSANEIFLGGISGMQDLDRISKAYGYSKETMDYLRYADRNKFLIQGYERFGLTKGIFPTHMHCEGRYRFVEMYGKHFPKRMKTYSDLIKVMRDRMEEQILKAREDVLKKDQKELDEAEKIRKEKEAAEKQTGLKKEQLEEGKQAKRDEKMVLIQKVKEEYEQMIGIYGKVSWSVLGKRFGISGATAKKYFEMAV